MAEAAKNKTRKVNLNDRILKALKPARDGKPYDVRDTVVPGLRARVLGAAGAVSYSLLGTQEASTPRAAPWASMGRSHSPMHAVRHKHGSISSARESTPKTKRNHRRLLEQQKRENTFAPVLEDFVNEKLSNRTKRPRGREGLKEI